MASYLINKNQDINGYNEVHTTTCNHLPDENNRVSIGWFLNAVDAVTHAKNNGYPNADGCYYCSNEAHKG